MLIQINIVHNNDFILSLLDIYRYIQLLYTEHVHVLVAYTNILSNLLLTTPFYKYSLDVKSIKTELHLLFAEFWSKFIQSKTTRKTGVLAFN